jgi:hypothetical protein
MPESNSLWMVSRLLLEGPNVPMIFALRLRLIDAWPFL